MYDIIEKKKHSAELTEEEIFSLVGGYVAGEIPDYQMSAWLMAVWFNGMTDRETAFLTDAMAKSGDMTDLAEFGDVTVDKHSTGGVGDKTTLIISPIVAACGGVIAKMSGRGLGHTGGTADKLESVPGYRVELSPDEFRENVRKTKLSVISQSGNITPADKKLYALRDVTATVDSIPLIASSVMSKKLAAGARSIVLDVKCGSGALMKTREDARRLASIMIEAGRRNGRRIAALITDMDIPLGYAVGNALEVLEAAELLRGSDKADKNLKKLCIALSAQMLSLSLGIDIVEAEARAENAICDGSAYRKLLEWISAQGGDVRYIENPKLFGKSKYEIPVLSENEGYITKIDTEAVGRLSVVLGAGRMKKGENIDPLAGIIIKKKTGEAVKKGDVIALLYTDKELIGAEQELLSAIEVGGACPVARDVILETVV